jgi:hypothetical protein
MPIPDDSNNQQDPGTPRLGRFASLDEEIASDVEMIRRGIKSYLYETDRFKQQRHGIEIIHPRIEYPLGRSVVRGPDWVRFQLSLYPVHSDLKLIDTIILRPRHIESGNVELMALYIRSSKTLVHYLYLPHDCEMEGSISAAYNEFVPYDRNRTINRSFHRTGSGHDTAISPLLYIISMIPPKGGNEIDKFFLRHDDSNAALLMTLDDVSHFYARHGY